MTTPEAAIFLPGATLGILGGGQLGKMIALEARRMGYHVVVLDTSPDCPAAPLADRVVVGSFRDRQAALELARLSDVVTVETEHIPWTILAELAPQRLLRPGPEVLRIVQDRLEQKRFLEQEGLPQTAFAPVDDVPGLLQAVATLGLPLLLKSRTGGYDGRGQARVHDATEAVGAWQSLGCIPAVAEAFVRFEAEISVILARGADGVIRYFPIAANHHRHGILHLSHVPAPVPASVAAEAERIAGHVARALDHVGVLAVEMFLLADGRLLVNEIAPRVHNSGHFSLGACATSQFEQHLRAVCGLALGDQSLLQPAAMLNLLGDLWRNGEPDWRPVLDEPHARLHLYGKRVAHPGRKMGHVLVVHPDGAQAVAIAERIYARLAGQEQ